MKIHDDHEVEEPEQITRFVCGAILGAVVGIAVIFVFGVSSFVGAAFTFVMPMVGCGLMALYLGDRFWKGVLEWLVWFR